MSSQVSSMSVIFSSTLVRMISRAATLFLPPSTLLSPFYAKITLLMSWAMVSAWRRYCSRIQSCCGAFFRSVLGVDWFEVRIFWVSHLRYFYCLLLGFYRQHLALLLKVLSLRCLKKDWALVRKGQGSFTGGVYFCMLVQDFNYILLHIKELETYFALFGLFHT